MNVRVRVDRLILDGFDIAAGDARTVGAAVEAELARVLSRARLSVGREGNAAHDGVRASGIPAASRQARGLGIQIGRAVGWSLSEPAVREQRGATWQMER